MEKKLDSYRAHLTEGVKKTVKQMKSDLVIIPGGMTSQLQVLDVVVNKPFKDNLRKQYSAWLLSEDHPLTPTGKIKKPTVFDLCKWILSAWSSISPDSIVKGFKNAAFQMHWMGQRMTAFGKKFLKMKMNLMRKMTMKMFKTFVLTWKKLKFAKLDFL